MRRRGFTLVELAVVVSVLSFVVPACFLLCRSLLVNHQQALFRLEVADAARGVSEELRADLRVGTLAADSLRVDGPGACFPVTWGLVDGVLIREAPAACGGPRALARGVRGLTRRHGTLTFDFALVPEDLPVTVVLPVGGTP